MHLNYFLLFLGITYLFAEAPNSSLISSNDDIKLIFKSFENALQIKFKLKHLNFLNSDLLSLGNSTAC